MSYSEVEATAEIIAQMQHRLARLQVEAQEVALADCYVHALNLLRAKHEQLLKEQTIAATLCGCAQVSPKGGYPRATFAAQAAPLNTLKSLPPVPAQNRRLK